MGSEEVKIMRRKKSCKTVNCEGVRLMKGASQPANPNCRSRP